MSKKELVERASTHAAFKKSLAREKKEVILRFLLEHQVERVEDHACSNSDDAQNPPLRPPPPPLATKTCATTSLSRKTKAELLEICLQKEGFQPQLYGKTKAAMLQFIRTPPPNPQEEEEEDGTRPVNIGNLLDTPDDPRVLRQAILKLLMDKDPFRNDPDLEAKLNKII